MASENPYTSLGDREKALLEMRLHKGSWDAVRDFLDARVASNKDSYPDIEDMAEEDKGIVAKLEARPELLHWAYVRDLRYAGRVLLRRLKDQFEGDWHKFWTTTATEHEREVVTDMRDYEAAQKKTDPDFKLSDYLLEEEAYGGNTKR